METASAEKKSIFDWIIRGTFLLLIVLVPLFFSLELTTYTLPKVVLSQILVLSPSGRLAYQDDAPRGRFLQTVHALLSDSCLFCDIRFFAFPGDEPAGRDEPSLSSLCLCRRLFRRDQPL